MPRRMRYTRPRQAPEEQLIEYLCKRFDYLPRERWLSFIASGTVTVNEQLVASSYIMKQQDTVAFDPPRELEPPVDDSFETLYSDDDLFVVSKSGNIPVAEGGRYCKATLHAVLVEYLQKHPLPPTPSNPLLHQSEANTTPPSRSPSGGETGNSSRGGEPQSRDYSSSSLYVVHRLDKETSGVVCMARTLAAAQNLSLQFGAKSGGKDDITAGDVEEEVSPLGVCVATKDYYAVLEGECREEVDVRLRIGLASEETQQSLVEEGDGCAPASTGKKEGKDAPQAMVVSAEESSKQKKKTKGPKDPHLSKLASIRMKCYPRDSPLGKHAHSIITPIYTFEGLSFVKVRILTGRTHQIRLHCAALGFPILGDKMYGGVGLGCVGAPGSSPSPGGGNGVDDERYLRRTRGEEDVLYNGQIVPRHLLHAGRLTFSHPCGGRESSAPGEVKSSPQEAVEGEGGGGTSEMKRRQRQRQITVVSDPLPVFEKECPFLKPFLDGVRSLSSPLLL